MADIDARLDYITALGNEKSVRNANVSAVLKIARDWVGHLKSFKVDHTLSTYLCSPRYRCVGLSFKPPGQGDSNKVVHLRGFPVWENAAFLSLSWCERVLALHAEDPRYVLGDFGVLHVTIEAPSSDPEYLLFVVAPRTLSAVWPLVASLDVFLTSHRAASGDSAVKSAVASLHLCFNDGDPSSDSVDDTADERRPVARLGTASATSAENSLRPVVISKLTFSTSVHDLS